MEQHVTFWQWYTDRARQNQGSELIGLAALFGALIYFSRHAHEGGFGALSPVVTDPFFVLAFVILFASMWDLTYMEYKVFLKQPDEEMPPYFHVNRRNSMVARRYEELYGRDLLVVFWRVRLVFLVCAAVAALRWISHWPTPRGYGK